MTDRFTMLDWLGLAGYAALLIGTGWWFSRKKQRSSSDYFLAGRSMPAWAVAVSTAATAISAATFVGVPEMAYAGDLTYLAANIGAILAILVVAFVFIPAFYRANVTTVYGLLEQRLGPGARTAASIAFLVGRVFSSGARLYIAAIPAAMIIWGDSPDSGNLSHLLMSIGALTAVGIVYTLIGGVRSVIWTDIAQTAVFVTAAGIVVAILLTRIDASILEIWRTLGEQTTSRGTHKTTIISTSGDPAAAYTLWASVFGMTLLYLAAYGTDHDMAQRMLTCKTPASGGRSAITAVILQVPLIALFLGIGSLLWIFHHRPDMLAEGARDETGGVGPPAGSRVFIRFIVDHGPAGLSGLTIAGLYAAALSTLNSGLNAMGASLYADLYLPLRKRLGKADASPKSEVRTGRLFVMLAGLLVGGFACFCVWWQRTGGLLLIDLALSVMTFAYAGLLAVFLAAILTRRGNSGSALAAILVGFVAVAALQPAWIGAWTALVPGLGPTPEIADDWRLGELTLAFPWQLTIGFAASFVVCISGKRRSTRQPEKPHDGSSPTTVPSN
ncbi:MAG: hypothetical protein KF705_03840 [Phycisphaeraceae bacterium]|nr:hypothetical protein [Phycisphaeraceae bacterium]